MIPDFVALTQRGRERLVEIEYVSLRTFRLYYDQ
jgi:hypothetical protein